MSNVMTYKEPTLINGQPLSFYLTHPGALKQVDKGVLQTLVVKYPYSAHLHLLLAIKDHLDNGIVSQDLLEKAALYIPDRKKLGEWMNKLQNLRRSDAYGAEHLEALAEQSVPEDIGLQDDRQLIDPELVATDHYEDDEFPTPEALEKIEEPVQSTETTWVDPDTEDEEVIEEQLAPDEELADISDEFSTEDARADLQAQVEEEINEPVDVTEEALAEVDTLTGKEETPTETDIHEAVFEALEEADDRSVDTYEDTIAEELPTSDWAAEEEKDEIEEDSPVRSEGENLWEEEEEEEEVEDKGVDIHEDQETWVDEIEDEDLAEESWREEEQIIESPEPVEDIVTSDEEIEERQPSEVVALDDVPEEESHPEIESPTTSHVYLDQEAEDLPILHTPVASMESSETPEIPDTELKLDTETIEDFTDHDSPFLNWLHRLSGTEAGGFEELSVTEEEESTSILSPVEDEKESKKEKKKKKDKKKKKKDKKKKKKKKKKRWEEESLRTDEALVSEALAEILANQGHYDRAIEMYKRLRLIIPEKSVFFAQKIEELESKK